MLFQWRLDGRLLCSTQNQISQQFRAMTKALYVVKTPFLWPSGVSTCLLLPPRLFAYAPRWSPKPEPEKESPHDFCACRLPFSFISDIVHPAELVVNSPSIVSQSGLRSAQSYFEPEALHAALVLVDGRLAVLGRVGGVGEEHALVALRLLVLADTAGLLVKINGTVSASWRFPRAGLGWLARICGDR